MITNKLQIKVFATGLDDELVPQVIPAFHRWITERALDEILVDVADYRHVFHGPGITLVGHESTYHIDEHAGRRGLLYFRKRGFPPGADPLLDAVRRTLVACSLLERDLGADGKLFDAGAVQVRVADRTAIEAGFTPAAFGEHVATRLAPVYGGAPEVAVLADGGLPGVDLRWSTAPTFADLLGRLPVALRGEAAATPATLRA